MALRFAKVALVAALALYYTLVVFNNLTDYDSNFQFVRHVLMMDSTFPGNGGMWRALNQPAWHTLFYVVIILWEAATAVLCGWGAARLARAWRGAADGFNRSKNLAIAGLTLAMLMWLVAFLVVGSEWFLMWQSKTWNGREPAFHMFIVTGIVLLFVAQRDREDGP
jgi:predicted small integral membrane protein